MKGIWENEGSKSLKIGVKLLKCFLTCVYTSLQKVE